MASGPDRGTGPRAFAPERRGFLRLLCAVLAAAAAGGLGLRRAGGGEARREIAPAGGTEARFWRRV